MSEKIFLVSDGEYSDYQIVAAFSTKEKADEAAKLMGGEVEVWELDDFDCDVPPKGKKYFAFWMFKDGTVDGQAHERPVLDSKGKKNKECYYLRDKMTDHWERKSYWRLSVRMYAKDEKHAMKIANEIRTQIIAGAKPREGDLP